MNSLSVPRSVGQIQYLAAQALAWWLSELFALLPEVARRLAGSVRAQELVLHLGSSGTTVNHSGRPDFGSAAISMDLKGESSSLDLQRHYGNAKVRVLLEESMVFHCRTELPAAAETSMAQILFHQMERLVPLEPSSISFAWRIADRMSSRKALTVAVTIVKKTTIDQATAFASQLGLSPSVVLIRQDDGAVSVVWRGSSTQKSSFMRWLYRGIEATTIAALVLAYAVSIIRLDSERARLTQQLQQAQSLMANIDIATKRFADTDSLLRSVRARLSEPTPLAALDEMTKVIPLDTSVSEFDFRPAQVSLFGTAAHSTVLLNLPVRSTMFEDARFTAPLTAAQGGLGEHFEMSVRLRQGKP